MILMNLDMGDCCVLGQKKKRIEGERREGGLRQEFLFTSIDLLRMWVGFLYRLEGFYSTFSKRERERESLAGLERNVTWREPLLYTD